MAGPLKIGLTGGIAAGKSEALAAFERLGAATISSDAVVHELLDSEPLLGRLTERWGAEIAPDGVVDRGQVGEIVFAEPEELSWLESQIHPLVGKRIGGLARLAPRETSRSRSSRCRCYSSREWTGSSTPPSPSSPPTRSDALAPRRAATRWSASARRASSTRTRRPPAPSTWSRTTARSRSRARAVHPLAKLQG